MENITPKVLQYREAARLIWNGFLREQDDLGARAFLDPQRDVNEADPVSSGSGEGRSRARRPCVGE